MEGDTFAEGFSEVADGDGDHAAAVEATGLNLPDPSTRINPETMPSLPVAADSAMAVAGTAEPRFVCAMLTRLRLHQVRCFGTVGVALPTGGLSVFTGANAQGKTTLLESICVLLRLQSPRASALGELVKSGEAAAAIEGDFSDRCLRVILGESRRMAVNGRSIGKSGDYLAESGLVVWMGNDDIQLVRGGGEGRRRFLDFGASQLLPGYLEALRAYERALRSRNFLLKTDGDPRQLAAYAAQLVRHGEIIRTGRAELFALLAPEATAAYQAISGQGESLVLEKIDGSPGGVAAALAATAAEETRRRATMAGPHRDDLVFQLQGMNASVYASEGQQRTIALALKVAQARVLATRRGAWPTLLLDDIFGELDPNRRHRLLEMLPAEAQKIATTTSLAWLLDPATPPAAIFNVEGGQVRQE
jgi:DNA replication and repair protein RecF